MINFRMILSANVLIGAILLLNGCFSSTARQAETSYYDLGAIVVANSAQPLPLRGVDVHAPSWLSTAAIQYRLVYGDVSRRLSYAESRWVAPPAELLEAALRRKIAAAETDAASAGCRLRIDVDEFVQIFDSQSSSRSVIEARVSLLAPKSEQLLARRNFALSQVTATPDARGGVAAFSGLTAGISRDVDVWLAGLMRDTPALAQRCAKTT